MAPEGPAKETETENGNPNLQEALGPLTEFHCFPRLPKEIQIDIWKLTFPGPRVVKLRYSGQGLLTKCTSKFCSVYRVPLLQQGKLRSAPRKTKFDLQAKHASQSPSTSANSPVRSPSMSTSYPSVSSRRRLTRRYDLPSRPRSTLTSIATSYFSTLRCAATARACVA